VFDGGFMRKVEDLVIGDLPMAVKPCAVEERKTFMAVQ
jgi:hypothetical protein